MGPKWYHEFGPGPNWYGSEFVGSELPDTRIAIRGAVDLPSQQHVDPLVSRGWLMRVFFVWSRLACRMRISPLGAVAAVRVEPDFFVRADVLAIVLAVAMSIDGVHVDR